MYNMWFMCIFCIKINDVLFVVYLYFQKLLIGFKCRFRKNWCFRRLIELFFGAKNDVIEVVFGGGEFLLLLSLLFLKCVKKFFKFDENKKDEKLMLYGCFFCCN